MRKAAKQFRKPAEEGAKSLVKIHDPFKLISPMTKLVVGGMTLTGKALFFTGRKVLNR